MVVLLGFLAALVAALSWAVSAAFYKIGAKDISPILSNYIRILLPLLIFGLFCLVFNLYAFIIFLTVWDLLIIFLSGLLAFVIGDALYFVTIQRIGISRGVPVTSTYPFFVLLIQILFLTQPIHLLMIPAVALTVVGVAIIGRQLETNPENKDVLDKRRLWIGLAAGVSTAFTWSISTFLLDALLDTINLFLIAVMRLTFATAIMTPFILGRQVVWGHPSLTQRHWIYLSIGGTIALAIGYVGFALSLQLVDITSATVLSSLTPLFALVIGWRSLKERVNLWTVTGVVTCVTGIILIAIAVSLA